MLTTYLQEIPNDPKGLKKIEQIDSIESWNSNASKSRFKVSNVKTLNTKESDYSPMIGSKKDDAIYFTSNRLGGVNKKKIYGWNGFGWDDLWMSKAKPAKKDKKTGKKTIVWETPVVVPGSLNSKFNEGTPAFDKKYSTIYYTQCNGADGKGKNCKIFSAKFNGTEWAEEQMLEFCMNDSFFYGHPTLSADGKRLYFASDRDDGIGGYDIWYVSYNSRAKSWGEPVNLGETVNTEKNEMYPYINDVDGHLYFSSNGHLGMGGLDIFKSEGSGTEWLAPENLRAPINSCGDDFGLCYDNTTFDKFGNQSHGFFTSNRDGGKGSDDIYEFTVDPLEIFLEGYVYECLKGSDKYNLSKPLANSTIKITNDRDSVVIELKTDAKGYYKTPLKEKTSYEINCTNRELYYFDAEPAQKTTKGIKISSTLRQDFCLNSQIIEEVVPIFYDLDKAIIRPDAAKVLDEKILPLLVKYPKLRLELGSHTDCRSSYDYNVDLPQRRADSAVAYLVRKGIDPRRIPAKGYGESQLTNDCKCEGGVVTGMTPYEIKDANGISTVTKKQIITRTESGTVVTYEPYSNSEITVVNGVKMVPCNEFQHSQNRRTTIKTLGVDFDPKVAGVLNNNINNTNVKSTIVKLTKNDKGTFVSTAANDIPSNGPSTVVTGNDIVISLNELRNLMGKKAIEITNMTNVTLADLTSGKLKPNATLTLAKLQIGTKERGYTLNNVNVKISATNTAPFTIGTDGLVKDHNATYNAEEGELVFKNINKEALKDGPIESNITKDNKTPVAPKDTLDLSEHKRIKVATRDGLELPTMINGKTDLSWKIDSASRKVEVSEDVAIDLLKKKAIAKQDFEDGESIKLKDGTKVPSKTFIIEKLEIGDVVMENVKVTINSKLDDGTATFGTNSSTFKKLNPIFKFGYLFMKPKEKKSKD